jgi:hypothetical protein
MGIIASNEKQLAYELNVTGGTSGSGVKKAFDLYLVKQSEKLLFLVVHMKIVFTFKDNGEEKWTYAEKISFVEGWKESIEKSWDRSRTLKILPDSGLVKIDFRFTTMIDACMDEHWQVMVTKIPGGSFQQSSVWPGKKKVEMDSEDLTLTSKGFNQKQRGSVHEFGHMLGIGDEYPETSKFSKEYSSVMNRGEVILARHDAFLKSWLDNKLSEFTLETKQSAINKPSLFKSMSGF